MAGLIDVAVLAVADLQSELPESLDAASTATERKAATLAPLVWREVLAMAPWLDAMQRVQLNADGAAAPAYGFGYQYALPASTIRVWRVDGSPHYWERQGQVIVSNDPGPLNVRLITEIDAAQASPLLISAAAARLAVRLARTMTGSDAVRARLQAGFEQAMMEAHGGVNSQRGVTDQAQAQVLYEAGFRPLTSTPLTAVDKSR